MEDNQTSKEPKLISLSGLGGMGKSQIALEFCYRNKEHYQYIFWMEADTDTALQSSFNATAKKLDLPILGKSPADVVNCTIEWFQENSGWLLVFDNADDYSLKSTSYFCLQDEYFPKSGRGIILMTTRLKYKTGQENMVVDLDEIKMDNDTALKLLLRENDDDGNALAIVQMLGHLPLALDLAGALMEIERCTPTEFLENYKNNMEDYLDPDDNVQHRIGNNYRKTIFTVWNVSFEHIRKNPLAASLIQSVAFLYPDNIPLALFERHAQTIFELDKTISPNILKRASQMLADFSLVQRITHKDSKQDDPAKDTLSVHRLVQTAILFKMELLEKLGKCKRLLAALSHELKPDDEHSSRIMEAYVPHVRHLIEQIMQFSPWPIDRPDIVQFSQWATDQGDNRPDFSKELMSLLSPTVVYLTSRHLFEGVENLAKLAILISYTTNEIWHPETATALSNLSYFYGSKRQFEDAERPCVLAWKIRRQVLGPKHKDTISTVYYLAFIYKGCGMENHATQFYWEAATVGDYEAQKALAIRYRHGYGAPINDRLAEYWEHQARQAESNTQGEQLSSHLNENFRNDYTPLHHAVQQGNIEDITDNITKYKIFANNRDRNGQTPLHMAAQIGNYTVAELMVKRFEADIRVEDEYGQTPLHLAVESGSIEVVKLLIDCGAHVDINRKDKNEQPPLYLAE
ncbi:hypothetical protein BC936DRAFT_143928 [Jimgerdemannia flammicorona]|uniref:DUF7779 domain-containing protein n=1 Tax=Jimgerdemannia flammicorona TaxID=994334 RepID=A0A433DD76_9FUNG|nr:hypothetical protein BC936DRAFT_143928 [Jimgerdemannia flammicorona]